jgi:outer membrane protein insertion porin family
LSTAGVRKRPATAALLLVLLVLAPAIGFASHTEIRVDSRTEIKKIDFRFDGKNISSAKELRKQLTLNPLRQPSWWRRIASLLPLVPKHVSYRLEPLLLQENVVILRTFLHNSGFPQAEVGYELTPAKEPNTYELTFLVHEGPELIIRDLRFTDFEANPLQVSGEAGEEFKGIQERFQRIIGRRWSDISRRNQEGRLTRWWKDRGYAFPRVAIHAEVDSVRSECAVVFQIEPGPASYIGDVTLTGNEALADNVILRELPFNAGDVYQAKDLDEGERMIQSLDLVRLASVAVTDSTDPSRLPVTVRVSEGKHRMITGEAGYDSESGITAEASWAHRNFTGGARVLTVAAVANTGWWALIDQPDIRYRGSVTLRQPFVVDRRLSLSFGPFIERRDDVQDRSWEFGGNATFLYERAQLRSVALAYEIARRKIDEYKIGFVTAGDIDLLSLLALNAQGALDSLGARIDRSEVTLSATLGTLPEPNRRRSSALFRPAIRVTTPSGVNDKEYLRLDGTLSGFYPLRRNIGLAGRVTGGRIYPFGKSIPATPEEEGNTAFLRLRDISFTAGGIDDVRGWENRLMGPKFPDIRFREQGDSVVAFTDGYVPIGGLARLSATVELRLPFPGLGPSWGTHMFLDAGRVWTGDERFAPGIVLDEEERFFYGTGGGVDFLTSVGAIRLAMGYKLNPSTLDLVDSEDALQAALEERPAGDLPRDNRRRWQLHFSFSSSF